MKQTLTIFYWGMLISFLGSLPPGIMNIASTQIAGTQGTGNAFLYAVGSMLAEIIIVRAALSGMSWLIRNQKIFHVLEWITVGLLAGFSVACFVSANSVQEFSNTLPEIILPPFITGIVISTINPFHIPFWLGWSTVLMDRGVLSPGPSQYNVYITGIGAGTIFGFAVYIFGGQYLLKLFQSNQAEINTVVGIILFVVAFIHTRKIIVVPAAVRHAKMFRQS